MNVTRDQRTSLELQGADWNQGSDYIAMFIPLNCGFQGQNFKVWNHQPVMNWVSYLNQFLDVDYES